MVDGCILEDRFKRKQCRVLSCRIEDGNMSKNCEKKFSVKKKKKCLLLYRQQILQP